MLPRLSISPISNFVPPKSRPKYVSIFYMRFLILFTVHNITHYQGDKGLFSDKKGLILVSGGSKAVFMALNFAGTGTKLLFEACTEIFRVRKSDHIRHFPYRIFPGNQQLFCLVQTDNADEVIRSLPGQRLWAAHPSPTRFRANAAYSEEYS